MKIIVNPHKIEIVKEPVNEREIDITKCYFEFADEITNDYVKEAYFTFNGTSYKEIIVNNECSIPNEVLAKKGQVEIGVVAFLVENEEEIKRYNPSPAYFNTWLGSLKDNAENSEPITPSEMEQFEQALNDDLNAIDTAIKNTEKLDVDVEKVETTTTVTITKQNGITKSVDILDGAKGDKGEQGYTPQKGIDYYTNSDKAEIEADLRNELSSMIPDVSNFITATVNNLVNYYLKTDVYNKDEINALISTSKTGIFEVVSELPTPSLQTLNTIYLVPSNNPKTQNVKDEYLTIPINDGYGWENIGSTSIDLSGYATETWVNSQISDFLTDTEIQQLINTAVNAKYTKPLTGIPKTDLVSTVQTSLDKADTAIQASNFVYDSVTETLSITI